jgi:hypothetical protein
MVTLPCSRGGLLVSRSRGLQLRSFIVALELLQLELLQFGAAACDICTPLFWIIRAQNQLA